MDDLPRDDLINELGKTRARGAVLFTQCRFLRLVDEVDALEHDQREQHLVGGSGSKQIIREKILRSGSFAWKR